MLCACVLSHFSHVQLLATLWTITLQIPLSTGFSRQEYWSGLQCLPPGDLPNSRIEVPKKNKERNHPCGYTYHFIISCSLFNPLQSSFHPQHSLATAPLTVTSFSVCQGQCSVIISWDPLAAAFNTHGCSLLEKHCPFSTSTTPHPTEFCIPPIHWQLLFICLCWVFLLSSLLCLGVWSSHLFSSYTLSDEWIKSCNFK